MKRRRFTEEAIISAVKRSEGEESVVDICRDLGISRATLYTWKRKYSGMKVHEAKRLRSLEEENRRLKTKVADLVLDNDILKFVNSKKC